MSFKVPGKLEYKCVSLHTCACVCSKWNADVTWECEPSQSLFCDTLDVVVVVVFLSVCVIACFVCLFVFVASCFHGYGGNHGSMSGVCVSWGGATVGGCSACLHVPHSSTATSHAHRSPGEESTHSSPAHSEPVVQSPRRSESIIWQYHFIT